MVSQWKRDAEAVIQWITWSVVLGSVELGVLVYHTLEL